MKGSRHRYDEPSGGERQAIDERHLGKWSAAQLIDYFLDDMEKRNHAGVYLALSDGIVVLMRDGTLELMYPNTREYRRLLPNKKVATIPFSVRDIKSELELRRREQKIAALRTRGE